jgi:hypothetical protein
MNRTYQEISHNVYQSIFPLCSFVLVDWVYVVLFGILHFSYFLKFRCLLLKLLITNVCCFNVY